MAPHIQGLGDPWNFLQPKQCLGRAVTQEAPPSGPQLSLATDIARAPRRRQPDIRAARRVAAPCLPRSPSSAHDDRRDDAHCVRAVRAHLGPPPRLLRAPRRDVGPARQRQPAHLVVAPGPQERARRHGGASVCPRRPRPHARARQGRPGDGERAAACVPPRFPSPARSPRAEYKPFLLSITVRSPHGDPLPRATVDFWQATTAGVYAYRSYGLRGRLTTDAHGTVEVLTVAPGDYGAAAAVRTGHFHMFLQDADGLCECLTTQLYVCHGNDVRGMNKDFLNWVRKSRPQNMLRAWSVPASNDGEPFFEFPELPTDDVDTLKRVEWWNAKLAEQAPDAGLKVVAGGRTEIRLNEKPGWIM